MPEFTSKEKNNIRHSPLRLLNFTLRPSQSLSPNDATSQPQRSSSTWTSSNFVGSALKNCGAYDARDLDELHNCLYKLTQSLSETGCYKNVTVDVKPLSSPSSSSNRRGQQVSNVTCEVTLNEKQWYQLGFHSNIAQKTNAISVSEITAPKIISDFDFTVMNVGGACEISNFKSSIKNLTGCFESSFDHFRPYSVDVFGHPASFKAGFNKGQDEYEETRSYNEYFNGVNAAITSDHTRSKSNAYMDLAWGLNWREILPTKNRSIPYAYEASKDVISESGPNLKNSIKFTASTNGNYLNSITVPSLGFESKFTAELAGPPGDIGYLKSDASVSLHLPVQRLMPSLHDIFKSTSVHLHTSFGAIKALSFNGLCSPRTNISDRYYLGGPLDFRGFENSGVGPRAPANSGVAGGDSLGGDLFYKSSIAASVPLPSIHPLINTIASEGRLFVYTNVGNLTPLSQIYNPSKFITGSRAAVGGGIAFNGYGTGIGCQFTYSKVLKRGESDLTMDQCWQVGVGFSFGEF